MSDRFPPLRPQAALSDTARSHGRSLPAPVDLTRLAAFVFVAALALI
jgi:hypothetical protein